MTSARLALGTATLASVLLLAADPASADEPSPTGVRLGLRSGYAVPAGEAFNGSGALADTIAGYIPARLDLGARLASHFYIGGLVQVGVIVPTACAADMECSGTSTRVGAMVAYHVLPSGFLDPWIGAGIGYEILNVTRSTASSRLELKARGIELLDAEVGIDLRPGGGVRLGPVFSLSMGRYTSVELNGTTTTDFDTVLHGWGMIGLRGAYDF